MSKKKEGNEFIAVPIDDLEDGWKGDSIEDLDIDRSLGANWKEIKVYKLIETHTLQAKTIIKKHK